VLRAIEWLGDHVRYVGYTPPQCIARLVDAHDGDFLFNDHSRGWHSYQLSASRRRYARALRRSPGRSYVALYGHGHCIVLAKRELLRWRVAYMWPQPGVSPERGMHRRRRLPRPVSCCTGLCPRRGLVAPHTVTRATTEAVVAFNACTVAPMTASEGPRSTALAVGSVAAATHFVFCCNAPPPKPPGLMERDKGPSVNCLTPLIWMGNVLRRGGL
jgi:hypothetical protein